MTLRRLHDGVWIEVHEDGDANGWSALSWARTAHR